MSGEKEVPGPKSLSAETHRRWWSSHLGAARTSGLSCGEWICLRSRWKYCAGVDGCAEYAQLWLNASLADIEDS